MAKCALCKCNLPEPQTLPHGFTLNRTTVNMNGKTVDVHHVCLPLNGRKWVFFKSSGKDPGYFSLRKSLIAELYPTA